jgi:hypothetical protein
MANSLRDSGPNPSSLSSSFNFFFSSSDICFPFFLIQMLNPRSEARDLHPKMFWHS